MDEKSEDFPFNDCLGEMRPFCRSLEVTQANPWLFGGHTLSIKGKKPFDFTNSAWFMKAKSWIRRTISTVRFVFLNRRMYKPRENTIYTTQDLILERPNKVWREFCFLKNRFLPFSNKSTPSKQETDLLGSKSTIKNSISC